MDARPLPVPFQRRKCIGVKNDGSPCGNWPLLGATVCRYHGGGPHVRAKGLERHMEAQATAWLAGQNISPLADVTGTLEELMAREVARFRFYEEQERRLAASDDLTVVTASQGEQLRALALGRERAAQAAQKALETWVRLGMDERRLRLDEAQKALTLRAVGEAFNAVLDDGELGLSQVQRARLVALIGERLG